ncbi:type IV secretory system conjugative DNA transfer family protein [Candidatus Parcubacteria bacterium]|nr:type IV secretory system conjugative DNA transfer family protein [Candidatus Parcubacteria bacterium]
MVDSLFNLMILSIGLVFGLVVLAFLIRLIVRYLIKKEKYFEHTVLLIRLPKEQPGDEQKEFNAQMIREEINKAEMMFAAIGGLRAQRGFKAWLLGRSDHYSFEIVASQKQIAWYAVAPREQARYIEQQIHSRYPEAVVEEQKDYNIFSPDGVTKAGYLRSRRSLIFPIKTYNKQESDPLNSIINVMSKLGENESLAIQYIVRSARAGWHSRGKGIGKLMMEGKTAREAIRLSSRNPAMAMFADLWQSTKPMSEQEKLKQQSAMPRLTQMEEEMLKGIEEKNSKAGLDVNLRIIVSADNAGSAKVYLENLGSAYSQYNLYEYGNSFINKIRIGNQKKLTNDFIYRRFEKKISFLLNSEEMASLYHLPLRNVATPNILWLGAKKASVPNNIPAEGIILGRNIFRGQEQMIRVKRDDRRRHVYIVGKSGVGKSVLQASMAIQDIYNGEGVCVIDPHGDLISDIISRIPSERAEDVILFSPADIERPLAMNLMEYDRRYPEQKTFVINELIRIFDKLYDLKSTGGPIFEQYMRNAMLLIMDDPASGSTLMEIPKVLADPAFRKMKLERCHDYTVVDFWKKEAEKAGGDAALANVVPYVTSKLTQFISNDTMRPIIAQQQSSFNFRDVMDKRKIFLVDLQKGLIGEMNAYLLGMILVGKILMAALSRTDLPQARRKDFYLYIDEFQNFTTDSISTILSEARKYNLNLTIAHQYIGQMVKNQDTSIKDAVFGNVGTMITFKIGSEDAQALEKEYSPVFNQFDLINIEKYTAYTKLLIDNTASRPFSMSTIWPLPGKETPGMSKKIRTLSRLKYGQDRNVIEAEIRKRGGVDK